MLGSTIDDAAGEAFDKVARLLGLPYPGGPHIDREARDGDATAVAFPRGLTRARDLEKHRYDFSFSGLKSAVARHVQHEERMGRPVAVADVAASFQDAVCDVLTRKTVEACQAQGVDTLLVGGGVAANGRLRELIEERATAAGLTVRVPRPGLCTDNGAMVAALGAEVVRRGLPPSSLDLRGRLEHAGHPGRRRLAQEVVEGVGDQLGRGDAARPGRVEDARLQGGGHQVGLAVGLRAPAEDAERGEHDRAEHVEDGDDAERAPVRGRRGSRR